MKLALHRSITFWSGLLVMAFVCWAWRDSSRYASFIATGTGSAELGNTEGGVAVSRYAGRSHNRPRLSRYPAETENTARLLPALFFLRGQGEFPVTPQGIPLSDSIFDSSTRWMKNAPRGSFVLFVPHWLILLFLALPWLGLLFWRARRRAATPKLDAFP